MDGSIEVGGVGEGVVGEIVRFEIVPDNLDVVEFGRVFLRSHSTVSQCLRASRAARRWSFADMDRSIVTRPARPAHGSSGLGAIETGRVAPGEG